MARIILKPPGGNLGAFQFQLIKPVKAGYTDLPQKAAARTLKLRPS